MRSIPGAALVALLAACGAGPDAVPTERAGADEEPVAATPPTRNPGDADDYLTCARDSECAECCVCDPGGWANWTSIRSGGEEAFGRVLCGGNAPACRSCARVIPSTARPVCSAGRCSIHDEISTLDY